MSAVSGHLLHCLQSLVIISCTTVPCSLWSSPVLCSAAVSGHLLYYVLALSLVISCTGVCSLWSSSVLYYVSLWQFFGHPLYYVSLVSLLVISCTVSAVSGPVLSAVAGHLLYCVRS
ncbi:unnamed protein product, partial [Staurois parvus]